MKIQTKITVLLLVLFAIGCGKEDDDTPVVVESSAKQLTSFVFNAMDNAALSETITVSISEAAKTASSSVSDATDVTALTPTITVSAKAAVSPSGAQDFSTPVTYTVTAEDGSTAAYSVSLDKEAPIATVVSISPLSGPKTTIVTFTGTDFGEDASAVQIFFDDLEAEVRGVTDTEITTVVPPRAFGGQVRILINGTEFTGFNFEYEIVDINVSTFAGGDAGFADGNGVNAQFNIPSGIAKDNEGVLYIADTANFRIRKITPDGEVSTFAGSGEPGFADGTAANASFTALRDVAVDNMGNVYVADFTKIRKITPEGIVSTLAGSDEVGFADGSGINAQFNQPFGIAVDAGGTVYVADTGNHKIRKITQEGIVSTLAGDEPGFADGNGTDAQFNNPAGLTVDASGTLYVADAVNNQIRQITTDGNVTTLAGNGTSGFVNGNLDISEFNTPTDVTLDALGNLYVSERDNHSIRKIDTAGVVSTVAGTGSDGFVDGFGPNAQFDRPFGLLVDETFTIYVVDASNHKIRKITQE